MENMIECYLRRQIRAGHITEEDSSIYRYGYTLLLEALVNLLLAVIIGVVTHGMEIVVGFLVLFIPLRSFCGGYHAKSFTKCMLLSNAVVIVAVCVVQNYAEAIVPVVYVVAETVSVAGILLLAPVQSENKRLEDKEVHAYQKIVRWMLLVEAGVFAVGFCGECWRVVLTVVLVHVIQVITLVVGEW